MDAETKRMVELATNPLQYDLGDIHWSQEGDPTTPWRRECRRVLLRELGDLAGKDILDIGSGTGHLSTLFPKAHKMVGLEPSKKNVEYSLRAHPQLEVINASLAEANITQDFDVAIAIMSFEHVLDLEEVFVKVHSFLRPGGLLCIMSYDFEYAQMVRKGREPVVKPLGEGIAVMKAMHDFGELTDIIRTPQRVITDAKQQGFILQKQVPMIPSAELIAEEPSRKAFEGMALTQLYIFKKDTSAL